MNELLPSYLISSFDNLLFIWFSNCTAICSLPSLSGPCRGNFDRWYFDVQMQKCLPFVYGGCRGNENRFETMDECTEACALLPDTEERVQEPTQRTIATRGMYSWVIDLFTYGLHYDFIIIIHSFIADICIAPLQVHYYSRLQH